MRKLLSLTTALLFLMSVLFVPIASANDPDCTRTPGYFKNHPEVVARLMPLNFEGIILASTTDQAISILSYGGPDPYQKLLKHLLAAKLNIHGGVSHNIQTTLDQAKAFLLSVSDPTSLTAAQKTEALRLATILDNYNNGDLTLGPGHCP